MLLLRYYLSKIAIKYLVQFISKNNLTEHELQFHQFKELSIVFIFLMLTFILAFFDIFAC